MVSRAVTGGMSEGWVGRWCAIRRKKVSGQLRNYDRSTKDYVMVATALSHKLSRHSGAVQNL